MGGGKKNENENENGRKREFATDPRSKRAREKYAVRAHPSLRFFFTEPESQTSNCKLHCLHQSNNCNRKLPCQTKGKQEGPPVNLQSVLLTQMMFLLQVEASWA